MRSQQLGLAREITGCPLCRSASADGRSLLRDGRRQERPPGRMAVRAAPRPSRRSGGDGRSPPHAYCLARVAVSAISSARGAVVVGCPAGRVQRRSAEKLLRLESVSSSSAFAVAVDPGRIHAVTPRGAVELQVTAHRGCRQRRSSNHRLLAPAAARRRRRWAPGL
jgi:hypothetical protein